MARRKKTRKPVTPTRFKVGDKVRVKHGVRDTDYPDIPLGGWTGAMFRRISLVNVTGLGDPDEESPYNDEMYGLLCDALMDKRRVVVAMGELEVPKGKPNRQLVKDYCHWFWNNR